MGSPAPHLRLSFQTKVLIPVLGFLVLLPVITLWVVNRHISQQVQDEARQTLVTAETVFLKSLEIRSGNLLSRYGNVVNDPSFKAILPLASLEPEVTSQSEKTAAARTIANYLNERLEDFGPESEVILFTTDSGDTLADARKDPALSIENFERAAAVLTQLALNGTNGVVGTICVDQKSFNVVSVPVLVTDTGPLVGALTIGIRLGEKSVRELSFLTGTEILLVADDQVTASTIKPGLHRRLLEQISPVAGISTNALKPRSSQQVVVNGEHFLALAGDFQTTDSHNGFRYLLLSSYEQQLLALAQTRQGLLWVSFLGILISATAVWFSIRRITQPLRQLRDSAEAVGRGDFSRRIERFSNDECGQLAETFNRMTESLQSSRSELEKMVETLRATQAQLIQSEKLSAVGQFVAGVAHELNNPLTAVIGFSGLLKQERLGDTIESYADHIVTSSERCHKIVQNLLSFSRQHAPERKSVDVNELIDGVVQIMAYDLRTSNIEARKNYQAGLPAIMADPHQLQQVFLNVLSNARQAVERFRRDGRITISTRVVEQSIRIEFEDNGPGIRSENLSRIFDPFFTTKPVGEGTGLGMSLAYGIIKEHRGNISVSSDLGNGATFVIELPICREAETCQDSPVAAPAPATIPACHQGQAVLIVDDEDWILNLAQKILYRDGYRVDAVSSGELALESIGRGKYDVIVCDWKMPGINGMQVYKRLEGIDPDAARHVLFMTGDVINENFQEFLKENKRDCLAKPFSIEEFRSAVAALAEDR